MVGRQEWTRKGSLRGKVLNMKNESFEKWVPSITNMYLQSKTHFTYDLDIFQIISTLHHPHTLQTIWILLRSSGYFSDLCKSFADLLNHLIIVRPSGSFLDEPNISKYSWLSSPGPQVFSNVVCIGRELWINPQSGFWRAPSLVIGENCAEILTSTRTNLKPMQLWPLIFCQVLRK